MNILAIGAHFDDIEIGCGGAAAKHVAAGDSVVAFVATKAGYKNPDGEVIRSDEVAQTEGRKAIVDILGAELICGEFETLGLEYSDGLFCELLKVIEDFKPELIYTHWTGDVHHDHRILAKATLHVSKHVSRVLMYRSNWYDSDDCFNGNFYVDISEYYDKKEQALRCHESELGRTGLRWLEYYKNEAINAGLRAGVKYAEVFEPVKWLQ